MIITKTPYYYEDGITIYHGDCLEILPELPKVDLVLTDPPYGVGMDHSFNDDFKQVEVLKDIKANLMAIFMSPRRLYELCNTVCNGYWKFERCLWWRKVADIAFPWHGWHMNGEAILIFSNEFSKWIKYDGITSSDTYEICNSGFRFHPNKKPLFIIKDLLLKLGGDLVLDPFLGSGTTAVACKQLGRKCIGIEIEEKYCEIAVKRLAQKEMF